MSHGPIPQLPAQFDGVVRASIPVQELADLAERHRARAAEYEIAGNAEGARQLRAVQSLLWAVIRGGTVTTVL